MDTIAWLTAAGSPDPWPVPNIPGMPRYQPETSLATSPTKGQHTREIMAEFGYEPAASEQLIADGVVT